MNSFYDRTTMGGVLPNKCQKVGVWIVHLLKVTAYNYTIGIC